MPTAWMRLSSRRESVRSNHRLRKTRSEIPSATRTVAPAPYSPALSRGVAAAGLPVFVDGPADTHQIQCDEMVAARVLQPGIRFAHDHQRHLPGHDHREVLYLLSAQPLALERGVCRDLFDSSSNALGAALGGERRYPPNPEQELAVDLDRCRFQHRLEEGRRLRACRSEEHTSEL